MANVKWDKLMIFLFVCLPLGLLIWCLKYCCSEDENTETTARSASEQRAPTRNRYSPTPIRTASYSPYSQRSLRLGFGIDNETTSASRYEAPYPIETSCPPASTTAPYPLSNTMPQPSITNGHSTAPFPLSNTSTISLPSAADQPPPSYAEVMQNK